jgi:hypothetical protein
MGEPLPLGSVVDGCSAGERLPFTVPSSGAQTWNPAESMGAFVGKLDASGNPLWSAFIDTIPVQLTTWGRNDDPGWSPYSVGGGSANYTAAELATPSDIRSCAPRERHRRR